MDGWMDGWIESVEGVGRERIERVKRVDDSEDT